MAAAKALWPMAQQRQPVLPGGGCMALPGGGVAHFLDVPWLAVSASRVRQLWLAGRTVDFLVPDAALQILHNNAHTVRQRIADTAATDPAGTLVVLPQDPGQAGKAQAQQYAAMLAGHAVKIEAQTGSKEVRATGFAAQQQAGNVLVMPGEWRDLLVAEHAGFPRGTHDDMVDACASAFNALAGSTRPLVQQSYGLALNE